MVDVELLISWMGSFLILIVLFKVFNKKSKKSDPISSGIKLITIGLCFHLNLIISLLLYEPIMEVFGISIDGFMNLNGLFTMTVIWLLIAVIVLAVAKATKEQLSSYYNIIRITQIVFIALPLLIIFLFLFIVNIK